MTKFPTAVFMGMFAVSACGGGGGSGGGAKDAGPDASVAPADAPARAPDLAPAANPDLNQVSQPDAPLADVFHTDAVSIGGDLGSSAGGEVASVAEVAAQSPDVGADSQSTPADSATEEVATADLADRDAATSDVATSSDTASVACSTTPTTGLRAFWIDNLAYAASTTVTYQAPKGFNVTGTVTLPSAPANGISKGGDVIFMDLDNQRTFEFKAATATEGSFTYHLPVMAGSYRVMTTYSVQFANSDAAADVTALSRVKFEKLTVCGDMTHDIALDALPDLALKTFAVSGLSALDTAHDGTGYIAYLTLENNEHTLSMMGIAVGLNVTGDSFNANLMVPTGSLVPTVELTDTGSVLGPPVGTRKSGLISRIELDPATIGSAVTVALALPPLVKMSGTVSDPGAVMIPGAAMAAGYPQYGTFASPVSNLHADTTDLGTFPDPPMYFLEASTGNIFSDALDYRTFVRKGVTFNLYGSIAIGLGAVGGQATILGENNYGYLVLPNVGQDQVTATTDFTKNYAIPSPEPASIKLTGVVQDAAGAAVSGAEVDPESTVLPGAPWDTLKLGATVMSDSSGQFKLNVLPGTYRIKVLLPQI